MGLKTGTDFSPFDQDLIKLMVKEVELALVKRQLNEAKEVIADLQADNVKLRDRIIQLEAVGPGL